MRHISLTARIPMTAPVEVFAAVIRFDRYADLAPHVAAASIIRTLPEQVGESAWELHFRSGLLQWIEAEHFEPDSTSFTFEQIDGDFDRFDGRWVMRADGADTVLEFTADFDFGISSLESILDPIAARVIKETVAWAVTGMFPGTVVDDATEAFALATD